MFFSSSFQPVLVIIVTVLYTFHKMRREKKPLDPSSCHCFPLQPPLICRGLNANRSLLSIAGQWIRRAHLSMNDNHAYCKVPLATWK